MSKFVVFKDADGQWRFRLCASNGKTILQSEGYKEKRSALKGIESVKKNAPGGRIVDINV